MWLLISTQIRRWLIVGLAVPALMFIIRTVRKKIDSRSSAPTLASKALLKVENLLGKVSGRRSSADGAHR